MARRLTPALLLLLILGAADCLSTRGVKKQQRHRKPLSRSVAALGKSVGSLLAAGVLSLQLSTVVNAAENPSPAALELVESALAAYDASPASPATFALLGRCIDAWRTEQLPAEELAGLYKLRAEASQLRGDPLGARGDLTSEIALLDGGEDLPRAFLQRARLESEAGAYESAAADAREALSRDAVLPTIERGNPFTYELLGKSLERISQHEEAAAAFKQAETAHSQVGDTIRAANAAADRALALYGSSDSSVVLRAPWYTETQRLFALKSRPTSNNPDDIPILQELSRKDAELHLALGARLYALSSDGEPRRALAKTEWSTGCVRLAVYLEDARRRLVSEDSEALPERAKPTDLFLQRSLRGLAALSSGLDPENPYVTQRPGQEFLWYELKDAAKAQVVDKDEDYSPAGDVAMKRRRLGSDPRDPRLATVKAGYTCADFGDATFLARERPEWPQKLRSEASDFVKTGRAPCDVSLDTARSALKAATGGD